MEEPSDDIGMQPVPPGRPKQSSWKYKAADVTMGFSSLLSNQRGPKPLRRPPHVVTKGSPPSARNVCDNCSLSQMQGLLPAPNVESEDDVDQVKQAPLPGVLGSAVATGVPCPAGKTARPDTCFMTHRYVKQEMAYLARRIDEVGRYFLALESMLGSGALGPVLERCLKELEFYLQEPEKLEEVEEAQSFIDAAIRLGLSPVKYKPLQDRLSWLCHGRRQEELRAELAKASSEEDALVLQQLIDDSLRSGIAAREMQSARLRLQELEQQDYNERLLAAAWAGDVETVEETLRKRGDCNSQQKCFPGFSLWHIAAEKGDLSLAELAKSFKCQTALLDHSGWSALMLASAKHDHRLVRALLDAGADPSTRSSSSEMIVDCDTDEQLQSVKRRLDETGRIGGFFEWTKATTAATLDLGDQLLAGEELLLPTFQRVGGRTALHTALLRPGHESNRIAVLDQILSHDISGAGALVNVQDAMERSPLWYAVKSGFVGCARHLIRAGALVSIGSMSCLRAAVSFISEESADDSVMRCGEDMCRLLRNGASDCMEEVAEAEAVLEIDLRSCQGALELEDALDADDPSQITFLECSQKLEEDYDLRLLTQRPQRSIASADEAADFAREVREELEELTCSVAHAFGGYAEFAPEPTAVRMSRLYRQQTRQGWIDANDWASVVGGCEATLVFPKLEDVYHALEEIAGAYSFQIRGVQDNLLSGNSQFTHRDSTYATYGQSPEDQDSLDDRTAAAEVAAAGVAAATHVAVQRIAAGCSAENEENEEIAREVAVKGVANAADAAFRSLGLVEEAPDGVDGPGGSKGGSRSGSKPASDVLTAMERGSLLQDASIEFEEPVYPDVQLLIDCSGCVCLLRLTTERVHEVVQAELDTGRWVLEELATAMRISLLAPESGSDGEDEILEILDAAEARFGRQYLAQILGIPLQDGWSCTVAGLAAHCGFASVLQILIDAGAPISQPRLPASCAPRGDYSPLSLAIAAQHWECISLLIACGADPFEDGLEELARHQSFTEAFQEKIMGLLNCAREQRLVDNNALAAMVKSVKSTSSPFEKIQRYLAFGADPNAESMLNTAAAAGQPELVTLLLDFGAMVLPETLDLAKGSRAEEVVRRRARARLHRAAEVHDVITMIQLVEAGLDPDSMLPDRSSLLTYASAGDGSPHFDLVVVLLQQKADPNQVDLAGHSALLCAVQSGSVELTQELLAHAANLHWSHPEQGTAAHMAARTGHVELLEVLLDAGASCSEQDGNGHDVAMLALRAADESCVTCIRQRGVLPNRDLALSELFGAVRKGNSEYLERLLEILVKIYPGIVICTEDGLQGEARSECPSLLVEAVRQGGVNMVKALLKAGARLYPHQVTVEPLTGMEQCESAWSIARALSSEVIAELLRNQLPEELLFLSKTGSSAELQNLREEERLGLVAEPKDFLLVDESGFGALDHALMAENLELEVWFCSHGARFQTQLEVLVEPVKQADYVALERRLRAGADVTVTDLSGRVALDWCIFTGFFESLLWDCVENSMNDEDEDGEGGATPSVSSKAAKTARSSRSGGRLSVRSKKTAMTTSNGSAMTGRRWPLVPFDPRGNFAPIEELLISYGAKFLLTRSAAACLYEPLLLHDFKTIERRAFAGADCSVDGDQGVGMVHVALDGGGVQAACALVLNGANPDVLDAHGRSVLWRAVEGDLQRLVDACLLQNIDLSQGLGKESISSVAHLALESNRPELSIQFLTRTHPPGTEVDEMKPPCVNPGALDSHGRTVLMRALELKHTSVAKVCLELKCSISVLDNLYEQSALHIAAEADPPMIPVLLEAQADINLVDKRGQSPLLTAAACGQLESVTLLHRGGAQLGPAGSFATMMAIEAGHFDVAAEIITMAGPFRPTELHRLRGKHSKKGTGPGTTLAPAAPGKMCVKAAELRAGAVMEAYLLQALRKLGYDACDFVQRFVQWILSGPSQELKSRSSLLEEIPTRLSDLELDEVLKILEARSVPAPVVQLLASANRFDPQPVHEQAADPESRPPAVPAGEDSRLDPPPSTTQTSEPEQAEAAVAFSRTEDPAHQRSEAAAERNDPADQQAEAPMVSSRTEPAHQSSQAAAQMNDPQDQQAEAPMVPSRTEDPKHQRSEAAAAKNDPADQQAEAAKVSSRTEDPKHQRFAAAAEVNYQADQQAEAPMVPSRTDPTHQRSQAAAQMNDPADQQAEAPMVPSRTDPTHRLENLSSIPENAREPLDQPPHDVVEMAERNEEPQVFATETARDSINEETQEQSQEYEEDDFENETEASELSPRSPRTFG